MAYIKDLVGQTIGNFKVLEHVGYYERKTENKREKMYKCLCLICNKNTIVLRGTKIKRRQSCGCLNGTQWLELAKERNIHIDNINTYNRLRGIWGGMKRRCYDPKEESYTHYGARGITICNEWLNDFLAFYQWAINRKDYSNALSIDRIDVNGNYEPDNCRWLNNKQQCNNKTDNRLITIDEETHTMQEWADMYNINKVTLYHRLENGLNTKEELFSEEKHQKKVNFLNMDDDKYIRYINDKYLVSIWYKNHRYYAGTYEIKEEAITARNEWFINKLKNVS